MVASVMGFSCAVISPAHALPLPPNTLWYNGDWDGNDALANERNTLIARSNVYDDFIVPVADGSWTVGTIWSNNFMDPALLLSLVENGDSNRRPGRSSAPGQISHLGSRVGGGHDQPPHMANAS